MVFGRWMFSPCFDKFVGRSGMSSKPKSTSSISSVPSSFFEGLVNVH